MAKIVRAAAKFQDIAKKGSVAETIVKTKQTIKCYEDKGLIAATKSASIKTRSGEDQKRLSLMVAATKSASMKTQTVEDQKRLPLKQVVTDCTKRWFQESLKEAKSGDIGMQVLVGQMYCSGYGIPRDIKKGKTWFQKASKSRLKILNLCAKPPGYSANESDSDKRPDKQK